MEEARYSFNVKFKVEGLEAQFTCRAGENERLGDFLQTIENSITLVKSLGAAPRATGVAAAGNGHKERLESVKPQQKVCTVCGKADQLQLIEFTPKGSDKSMFKYKCERCNKWLSYTPSDEEITAFHQQSFEALTSLWK